MKETTRVAGLQGEQLARTHLTKKGYKIVRTNWRFKRLEVDIIAEDGGVLVFVEVKTRASSDFGEPELFVNRKKQGFLIEAAHHYLNEHDIAAEARFDVVSVLMNGGNATVTHLESAFYPKVK
jgi:putative endonuclease